MTAETKRLSLSAAVLLAAAIAAVTVAPSLAQASAANAVPVRLMDTCPNPAPYWCWDGNEQDRCPGPLGSNLVYRGCADATQIQ